MIALLRMLLRGQSRGERARGRLMSAGAALATFLLLVAVDLLAVTIDRSHAYLAFLTLRDDRLVTALALGLLTIPTGGFVYQVSRLAAATRERRLAALRLAGATPREVRLIAAYESGWRALLGALLGGLVFLALNLLLRVSLDVPVVPPFQGLLVLAVIVLAGGLSGLFAGRHVISSPLGLVRRARVRRARLVDLLIVVAGIGLFVVGAVPAWRLPVLGPYGIALSVTIGAVLMLFGLVMGATWLIGAVALRARRRASSAEALLAARMVEADPRAWARALTVVGLTVFFGAAVGAQQSHYVPGVPLQSHQVVNYALVYVALLLAMVASTSALVVHQAEELLDHRRSFSVLVASGVPISAIRRALTRQAFLAAIPVCVVAAVAGLAVIYGVAPDVSLRMVVFSVLMATVLAGIGVAAAVLAARFTRVDVEPIIRAS